MVNAFLTRIGGVASSGRPDGIYLTAGHIVPPLIPGAPTDTAREMKDAGQKLEVQVAANLFITRDRAQELIGLLVEGVAALDSAAEQGAK